LRICGARRKGEREEKKREREKEREREREREGGYPGNEINSEYVVS